MSHIKNIEIKNFKSIRHAKIEDCRRVNVFIGYPNVGKSNILEAMSLFHCSKSSRKVNLKDFVRFEDAAELFFEGNARENAIISYNDEKSLYLKYNGTSSVSITPENYDESRNYVTFERENIGVGFSELFNFYKYHFDSKLIGTEGSTSLQYLSAPFGENLYYIVREYEEIRKEFNELLKPFGLKILMDKITNSLKLIKTVDEDSIFTLSFSLLADTLQRVIFYKSAIETNSNSVLLFEEPEAHMFPPFIARFTTEIMYDKNNNQYFIATHSPFVLNDFMEDMDNSELSIYAVGYVKGETTIIRLTDKQVNDIYQYGVDLFFNLEDFLKDVVA
ncbi:MAG: AAA family ATPase [Chitinophagaceae bacterium]|nr:AAA family ATPase [Chitinophagaceae bacterium]